MKVVSKTIHCFLFLVFLSERRLGYWCVVFKRIVWGQGETWTQSVRSGGGSRECLPRWLSALDVGVQPHKRSFLIVVQVYLLRHTHTVYSMFAHRWKNQRKPWRRGAPVWMPRSTPSPVSWRTWRAARPTSPGAHKYDVKQYIYSSKLC